MFDRTEVVVIAAAALVIGALLYAFWATGRAAKPDPRPASRLDERVRASTFRVKLFSEQEWTRVSLLSVHGDFMKVAAVTEDLDVVRYGTVVIHQVHPDDKGRVSRMSASHPTASDRYEFS